MHRLECKEMPKWHSTKSNVAHLQLRLAQSCLVIIKGCLQQQCDASKLLKKQ